MDKRRYEVDLATQNSLHYGIAEEYDRAADEATSALRCMHEIEAMEQKVIDMEQQIIATEHNIARLHQQEVALREENCHHATHINKETKEKLDEITRQLKTLRG
ncbi:hypothetical protein H7X69_00225 [Candidatus Saccharibacteria bacterium]|nr:hypothetical protein [Candidatus Saccharibacteria bacterium]